MSTDSIKKLSADMGMLCIYDKDVAEIAKTFSLLYDARELADYDVVDSGRVVQLSWASDAVNRTKGAFSAWDRVKSSDEAKVFLASLIFGNRRARPIS